MDGKKSSKLGRLKAIFAGFLLSIGVSAGVVGNLLNPVDTYAIVSNGEQTVVDENLDNVDGDVSGENDETENNETNETTDSEANTADEDNSTRIGDGCKESMGAIGWFICPTTGTMAKAVDWLYEKIEDILIIQPISTEDGTPIYEIWKYCLSIANIVFIIFLLIVVYSQLTGLGISNYGVKKSLPKLIVAAVLVNISFLVCLLAVDVSNILGASLRGLFTSVEEAAVMSSSGPGAVTYAGTYSALAGGSALVIGGGAVALDLGMFWMLIPVVLGAMVAVITGLVTVALRQAVVVLLVMISPLAMVAYMLPNTEKWFKKWKELLMKMLVFYPMFSLLFGASSLAGFAIIMSAKDGFWVLLGMAVQIFPLFFSWKLMQMSGTILGDVNSKIRGLAAKPLAANRAWAGSHQLASKQRKLASSRPYTPSLRLMQFMSNRRIGREADIDENAQLAKQRALARRAERNWQGKGATGLPTKRGERVYEKQAQGLEYQRIIDRDKNTMNKGLGYLAKEGTPERARLNRLDARMVNAAAALKTEQARGEKIEYDNAKGMYQRMNTAINAHMDDINGFEVDENGNKIRQRTNYKFHLDPTSSEHNEALAQYNVMHQIMEGSAEDVQFAVANTAQGYDTQKKIIETKMHKYFDMTVPTKDVENRLGELTKLSLDELRDGKKATNKIDMILPGLRILNQRGDTDLVKKQMDNILDVNVGGGVELGSYASQSLASFLMFEVKDNDPFMRRFGKYINLETARAFNANDRKEMEVTYDEYVKGYHIEPDGTKMYAKKGMKQLMEGTSLDNIERTALSNLDESLKRAYGFEEGKQDWDVSGYLRKREEVQTAFEPAFLSASLKWMSGSEQINSGVKFWTGYEQKQKKDENGNLVLDKNGDPEYELTPVWEGKEFAGHEEEVEKYYRRKTGDYFKDQTTGQILGMRSDYRDATMEHLLAEYLDKNPDEERKYNDMVAEIQTRYADKDVDEANKLRAKDIKKLKMELAGRQVRKILGETGKLKQIHRLRRSGVTNNAKDWLRQWVNLDNEEALRKEVVYYDELQKKAWEEEKRKRKEADPDYEYEPAYRVYDKDQQSNFLNEMSKLNDDCGDEDPQTFFDKTREKLNEWFPDDYIVWAYERFFKNNPNATNDDLYGWLKDVLEDLGNYPGNRDLE